ncbi:hypothetical protein FM107_05650 [Sphingobacterium sp. JB170]|nr:hypothetical protein FM107_05650 [Sphingobacterium sp. JB170]
MNRLLLSNDKKSVLPVARNEKQPPDAKEIVKDPMFPTSISLAIKYSSIELLFLPKFA